MAAKATKTNTIISQWLKEMLLCGTFLVFMTTQRTSQTRVTFTPIHTGCDRGHRVSALGFGVQYLVQGYFDM